MSNRTMPRVNMRIVKTFYMLIVAFKNSDYRIDVAI